MLKTNLKDCKAFSSQFRLISISLTADLGNWTDCVADWSCRARVLLH